MILNLIRNQEDIQQLDYLDYAELIQEVRLYPRYLIIAHKSNWQGLTGYKIVEDKADIFRRDHECTQTLMTYSKKRMTLREASHDRPTGYIVEVIGLTDDEVTQIEANPWRVIDKLSRVMKEVS